MDFLLAFSDNLAFFFRSLSQGYTTVLSELGLGSGQLITEEDYVALYFEGNLKTLAQESHSGLSLRGLSLRGILES